MSNPYQNALDVQDACNLSGVVHSLSRDVTKIWKEVRENGGSTEEVNTHPVVKLYLSKLCSLAGYSDSASEFLDAHDICEERAATAQEKQG